MIKRNRLEREEREKRAQEEAKRQALQNELTKMAKTHQNRKAKKKQVKEMMEEAAQLLYAKEEARRETVLRKLKRSNSKVSKTDVQFEPFTVPFNT